MGWYIAAEGCSDCVLCHKPIEKGSKFYMFDDDKLAHAACFWKANEEVKGDQNGKAN
jgi:hypothetical protein